MKHGNLLQTFLHANTSYHYIVFQSKKRKKSLSASILPNVPPLVQVLLTCAVCWQVMAQGPYQLYQSLCRLR